MSWNKLGIRRSLIFLTAIMLLTCTRLLGDLVTAPYRGDEASYINDSRWFDDWLTLNFINLGQVTPAKMLDAPVAPLLIGASRHLAQLNIEKEYSWAHGLTEEAGVINHSSNPSAQLLLAARLPMGMLAVATVMVLTALVLKEFGYLVSSITAALILLNPSFINWGRLAMTEPPLLFFVTLGVAIAYCSLSVRNQPRIWLSLCLGLVLGLTTASKLSGVLSLAAWLFTLAVALVLVWLTGRRTNANSGSGWQKVRSLCVSTVLALASFTLVLGALNPYLWDDPLRGLEGILNSRLAMTAGQTERFPNAATNTWQRKASAFLSWVFTNGSSINCSPGGTRLPVMDQASGHLLFEEVGSVQWVQSTLLCSATDPWNKDVRPLTLVNLFVFLSSCTVIIFRGFHRIRGAAKIEPSLILLIWTSVISAGTLAFLPMAWAQYFLPPIVFTTVVSSIGTGLLMRTLMAALVKNSPRLDRAPFKRTIIS